MTDHRALATLVVGIDPGRIAGMDVSEIAPAFDAGRRRAKHLAIDLVECLVAPDESAVVQIADALRERAWDCVDIGGGLRAPDGAVGLLEVAVNLVRRVAPQAVIAFNTSPVDSADAALRAHALVRSD